MLDPIAIQTKDHHRKILSVITLMGISIIIGTLLRVSLLVIYPLLALFASAIFRLRVTPTLVLLTIVISISFISSLFAQHFIKYKMLSLFYMFPFLLLLFSKPAAREKAGFDNLEIFIHCLALIAAFNNVIGLIQVWKNPASDDSFMGIYSNFSVSLNGLVLLNVCIALYYFINYVYNKRFRFLLAAAFFFICGVLGYYGAGLIICLLAMLLCFFRINVVALFKTIIISIGSILVLYSLIMLIKPSIILYNKANIQKIATFDVTQGPRKITSFYNYAISYPKNIKDFLLGSGPGTFNSRSAFMVGSPSYFTSIPFIKDKNQPYYFKNYAYTLWNESNTSQAQYLDGFRNQPFSSVLAFLGEYGLIFTLLLGFLYYRYYKDVSNLYKQLQEFPQANIYFRYFKFLVVLLPLLLLIDNYYEYPEIMLLVLLVMKFAHEGLLNVKASAQKPQDYQ